MVLSCRFAEWKVPDGRLVCYRRSRESVKGRISLQEARASTHGADTVFTNHCRCRNVCRKEDSVKIDPSWRDGH